MGLWGCVRSALFALALAGFSAPPAEAVEFVDGAQLSSQGSDGLLTQVRAVRHGGGGHRGGGYRGGAHRPAGVHRPGGVHRPAGGVHRPVHRPGGVHRPPVHRPGVRPPVHRPGYRPPVHRPGVGAVNRPGYRPVVRGPVVVAPRAVWVGRPGWYRWSPGGAIAAGAALGFVTAAAAASLAGPPPQAGLCWYYTDPSRRQGFWDACP